MQKKISWRCEKRGCNGNLKTTLDFDIIKKRSNNHNKNTMKNTDKNTRKLIKERAFITSETLRNIVLQTLNNENTIETCEYTSKYLQEQVNKIRKQSGIKIKEIMICHTI